MQYVREHDAPGEVDGMRILCQVHDLVFIKRNAHWGLLTLNYVRNITLMLSLVACTLLLPDRWVCLL